jgi:hypothetical protein
MFDKKLYDDCDTILPSGIFNIKIILFTHYSIATAIKKLLPSCHYFFFHGPVTNMLCMDG